ncbi:hypothetical protein AVEN_153328-1 [Araneus ventricosus]|uniref:Uncharacterized protein n=1 Tax=Araneus ventricosus TaxID=182803 RepID=A0A4Y2H1U4_ARAVE|nr:hypothetical protein AVEN_153328-1 [Araneus ventricosus]
MHCRPLRSPIPLPHTGEFRFLERAPSIPRPDFLSLTASLTRILPPQRSHTHIRGRFIARLKESYFIFMTKRDEWKSYPTSRSVYANDEMTKRFGIMCSNKNGLDYS